MDSLLAIKNLRTHFFTSRGVLKAVDGLNLELKKGERLGLVGESGCGKSVTALSIMRLVPSPPGKIISGEILLEGEDILKKRPDEMRLLRGRKIAMIFQDPMSSLNPVLTIRRQLTEGIRLHQKVGKEEALRKAIDMLKMVNLPYPEERIREYPHQFSGGMRQRVMIAMTLSCKPSLLIADEPTTALDVTIQAQILNLMNRIAMELNTSILWITHDLRVVAKLCERIAVMYAGSLVEVAPKTQIFMNPLHPYTVGLLNSIPRIKEHRERLQQIPGNIPDPCDLPSGCKFRPRCNKTMEQCHNMPELLEVSPGHLVSCFLYK